MLFTLPLINCGTWAATWSLNLCSREQREPLLPKCPSYRWHGGVFDRARRKAACLIHISVLFPRKARLEIGALREALLSPELKIWAFTPLPAHRDSAAVSGVHGPAWVCALELRFLCKVNAIIHELTFLVPMSSWSVFLVLRVEREAVELAQWGRARSAAGS